jgi:hypothetical protein
MKRNARLCPCNYNAIIEKLLLCRFFQLSKNEIFYVLFMVPRRLHYNFRFFHLSFVFPSFLARAFLFWYRQVGLEVAHPGVANDFNDEGEPGIFPLELVN